LPRDEKKIADERHLHDDVIDVGAFIETVWRGKWLVTGIVTISTICAIAIALYLPNLYRAEALLAPVTDDATGGIAALAGRYQGLADLAGINLGERETDKTSLGIETLKSRQFISNFVKERNILVPLMAAKSWDRTSDVLAIDDGLYDSTAEKWVRSVTPPMTPRPSEQEAYAEFSKRLSVSEDPKTGFVRVSFEHLSPRLAQQWVHWLVEDLNATIMQRDATEAQRAIEYLYTQIESTSVANLQSVFFGLIEEQTKTIMLARMSPEYLFRTIDPAVAPEVKSSPNRPLIVALGMIFGTLLGLIAVILKGALGGYRA
jgi:uncharacterized protein involved in exopolysaccharide biosynthesis